MLSGHQRYDAHRNEINPCDMLLDRQPSQHILCLQGAHVLAGKHAHEQHRAPQRQGDLAPQRPTLHDLPSL